MTSKFLGLLIFSAFVASSASAEYTPLLDKLYEASSSPIKSAYSVSSGSVSDYNFIVTDGEASEYYKMVINADSLVPIYDGSHALGLDGHKYYGSFDVRLPNGGMQTISYVYGRDDYDPTEILSGKTYYNGSSSAGQTILNKNIEYVSSGSTLDTLSKKLYENNKFRVSIYNNNVIAGGAILSNEGTVNAVNADFINNATNINNGSTSSDTFRGGAIYNKGLIKEINSNFIKNSATNRGGAIYNAGGATIENINGNFVANKAINGGAIYNDTNATINNIKADFIANEGSNAGGIYNAGKIGSIIGNFIAQNNSANGGGISNINGTIDSITGHFIGNIAFIGAGIDNQGTIGEIYGDFISNGCKSQGCAVRNRGKITSITGDFIANYGRLKDDGTLDPSIAVIVNASGGGMTGYIENITGNFIGNDIVSIRATAGIIENVKGSFIDNTNDVVIAFSGDSAKINNINAEFIGNKTAIDHSKGAIDSISGKFINNDIAVYSYATSGKIEQIEADFIGNKRGILSKSGSESIGNVKGDFTRNIADDSGAAISIYGGSIIGDIGGNFSYNGVECGPDSINVNSRGGAIHIISSTAGNISGTFIGNYVSSHLAKVNPRAVGGAIFAENSTVGNIEASFTGNHLESSLAQGSTGRTLTQGSGIYFNGNNAGNIVGNFSNNVITTTSTDPQGANANGGALYSSNSVVGNVIGDFTNNGVINTSTKGNATGGAIGNVSGATMTVSGNFIGNFVKTKEFVGQGGAIHNSGTITLLADGKDYKISGNYIQKGDEEKKYEAIHLTGGEMNIKVENSGTWQIDDMIAASNNSTYLNILGVNGGTVKLYNNVSGTARTSVKDVIVDLANDKINTYKFYSMSSSNSDYMIDVDFENTEADKFIIALSGSTGTVNISKLNFIGNDIASYIGQTKEVKVIEETTGGLVLNHSIGSNLLSVKTQIIPNSIQPSLKWSDIISARKRETKVYGGLDLSSSRGGTLYDSLKIKIDNVVSEDFDFEGETLNLLNTYATTENRYFTASSVNEVYTIGTDVGTTSQGSFEIQGLINNNSRSTLDFNGHNGFDISNKTKLSLTNMAVTNIGGALINISNQDAVVNLKNVNVVNNNEGIIVASGGKVNIIADKYSSNFDNPRSNFGISMTDGELNFQHMNGGNLTVNDLIILNNTNLNIFGDKSGEIMFKNSVITDGDLALGDGSVVHLGVDSNMYVGNMKHASSSGILTQALGGRVLKFDVEVDRASNAIKLAIINVSNQLSGVYTVLINALNQDKLDNDDNAIVPFLFALNDTDSSDESFNVIATGSPYEWVSGLNVRGETQGSTWYLKLKSDDDDDNKHLTVRPEVMAAIGLHEAAIEQTRSVTRNVRNKVAAQREYCPGCGIYPTAWDGKTLRNAWVLAQGETANIDKVADIDAKIWGIEAGFDIQNNVNNTLGVFASYRDGSYDLNGKGSRYHSSTKSDIDIDSWLAGLYYRYDKNMNWLFAAIYGGIQKADVKTGDGYGKFDTDGIEFGASAEIGHTFALTRNITLDPSLGVYYTQLNFDDTHDNIGKEYKWDNIKHVEAELGAKLTKQFSNYDVYAKPSVIQTITGRDKVRISGLNKTDTYHDQTLGRIELGGRYGFTDALSGYAWGNYTFGPSYEAYAGGLGLNYAW